MACKECERNIKEADQRVQQGKGRPFCKGCSCGLIYMCVEKKLSAAVTLYGDCGSFPPDIWRMVEAHFLQMAAAAHDQLMIVERKAEAQGDAQPAEPDAGREA